MNAVITKDQTQLIFIDASLALEVEGLVFDMINHALENLLDYVYYQEGDFVIEIDMSGDNIVALFNGELHFNRRSLINAIIDYVS